MTAIRRSLYASVHLSTRQFKKGFLYGFIPADLFKIGGRNAFFGGAPSVHMSPHVFSPTLHLVIDGAVALTGQFF
jgi:hypothetical protein